MEEEEACLWAKNYVYSSLGLEIKSESRVGFEPVDGLDAVGESSSKET